jgi:hypothetical protein
MTTEASRLCRRTLVSVTPEARHRDFAHRAERPISQVIGQVVAGMSGEQQRRVEAALEVLGGELLDRSPGAPAQAGRRHAAGD